MQHPTGPLSIIVHGPLREPEARAHYWPTTAHLELDQLPVLTTLSAARPGR